ERILESIFSIHYIIPTIRSLFMDLRFLEPLSQLMVRLGSGKLKSFSLDMESRPSVRKLFKVTPNLEANYLRLWLFLIQNFAEISNTELLPRCNKKKAPKPNYLRSD